jgi:flagella basal body P-ring formation protein FlgA
MQGYFFDSSGISNQELTRNLRTGEPLRTADLRPALLIRRGSGVLLTVVTSGGVEISIRVEALQDARMGEKIQLKNPDSGRLMNGVVTGPNTARGI